MKIVNIENSNHLHAQSNEEENLTTGEVDKEEASSHGNQFVVRFSFRRQMAKQKTV